MLSEDGDIGECRRGSLRLEDRLWARGLSNVHKKLLIQATACNLALLMRSRFGTGKPKAAHDGPIEQISPILCLTGLLWALCAAGKCLVGAKSIGRVQESLPTPALGSNAEKRRFRPGLLARQTLGSDRMPALPVDRITPDVPPYRSRA